MEHQHDPYDPDVRRNRAERESEVDRTGLNRWLAGQLAERRKQLGMSLETLAERSGLSVSALRRLESPSSNPRFNDLQEVLSCLRLNLRVEAWPD